LWASTRVGVDLFDVSAQVCLRFSGLFDHLVKDGQLDRVHLQPSLEKCQLIAQRVETLSDPSHGFGVGEPAVLQGSDPLWESGSDASIPLALKGCELVFELLVSASPPNPDPRDDLTGEGECGDGNSEGISLHCPTCPLLD